MNLLVTENDVNAKPISGSNEDHLLTPPTTTTTMSNSNSNMLQETVLCNSAPWRGDSAVANANSHKTRRGNSVEFKDAAMVNNKEYWAAVRVVHEEIQKLPAMEKAAYLQACDCVAPAILRKEASALQFLQFEKLDFAAAAKRLCRYWSKRQELFANRWRLPVLCLDGITGALSERDLSVLKTGVVAKLHADATGRAVLYLDQARCHQLHRLDISRVRCWFFWLQEIASSNNFNNDNNPERGLWVLRYAHSLELNKEILKQIGDMAKYDFPIGRLDPISCCLTMGDAVKRDEFANILAPVTRQQYSTLLGMPDDNKKNAHYDNNIDLSCHSPSESSVTLSKTLICDTADEMRETLFSLQDADGVHYFQYHESIPVSLGGCWNYSKFEAWLQHRVQYGYYKNDSAATSSFSTSTTTSTVSTTRRKRTALERIFLRKRIRMKMDALFSKTVHVQKGVVGKVWE